jgi:hypothetical protein
MAGAIIEDASGLMVKQCVSSSASNRKQRPSKEPVAYVIKRTTATQTMIEFLLRDCQFNGFSTSSGPSQPTTLLEAALRFVVPGVANDWIFSDE